MAKISQREARALKKRVTELEAVLRNQRDRYSSDWPGGVHIGSLTVSPAEWHIVNTARKLGHAVVVVPADIPKLHVYGCVLPKP